jgi:adenylylsulfate kinase
MANIYPNFSRFESREKKERQLYQQGFTLWFTGLSGSGKSIVAAELERLMTENGHFVTVLDGDNLRFGINADLGFSEADRMENVRRTAEICRLMNNCAIIVIATLVSPTEKMRTLARSIIGRDSFQTVHISTPLSECERRDVKGLYARARRGEIADFTGISAPFEPPQDTQIEVDTTALSGKRSAEIIFKKVQQIYGL